MESSRPNSLTADLSVEKDGHGSDSDSDEDEEGEEGSEGQEETHSTASKSSSRRKKFQDPKPYKCLHPGCGAAYKKPSKLAIHELTHSGEVSTRIYVDCFLSLKSYEFLFLLNIL